MNDLDQRIRNALLRAPGGSDLAREPGVAEELIGTFRTRHRFLHAFAFALTFAFFAVAVVSGFRFAAASDTHAQIAWGGACLLALTFTGFLKVYFWLEIHTNRMLRELKRVELLLAVRDSDSLAH